MCVIRCFHNHTKLSIKFDTILTFHDFITMYLCNVQCLHSKNTDVVFPLKSFHRDDSKRDVHIVDYNWS